MQLFLTPVWYSQNCNVYEGLRRAGTIDAAVALLPEERVMPERFLSKVRKSDPVPGDRVLVRLFNVDPQQEITPNDSYKSMEELLDILEEQGTVSGSHLAHLGFLPLTAVNKKSFIIDDVPERSGRLSWEIASTLSSGVEIKELLVLDRLQNQGEQTIAVLWPQTAYKTFLENRSTAA